MYRHDRFCRDLLSSLQRELKLVNCYKHLEFEYYSEFSSFWTAISQRHPDMQYQVTGHCVKMVFSNARNSVPEDQLGVQEVIERAYVSQLTQKTLSLCHGQ